MKIVFTNPVFGKNLRHLRKQYGLSRKALGRLLDVSVCQIRQLEAERWPIAGIELESQAFFRIGAVFDLDANDLLTKDLTL